MVEERLLAAVQTHGLVFISLPPSSQAGGALSSWRSSWWWWGPHYWSRGAGIWWSSWWRPHCGSRSTGIWSAGGARWWDPCWHLPSSHLLGREGLVELTGARGHTQGVVAGDGSSHCSVKSRDHTVEERLLAAVQTHGLHTKPSLYCGQQSLSCLASSSPHYTMWHLLRFIKSHYPSLHIWYYPLSRHVMETKNAYYGQIWCSRVFTDVTAMAMDGEKLDVGYLVGIYPDISIFGIIEF